MKREFLLKFEEKQKFHKQHGAFTEKAYRIEGLLPDRYAFILTNRCNLKCHFCYQKREFREDAMTADDWINLTKQLPDYARVLLTGGEPLMFKEFKKVFSYIAERFSCNIITNGILLNHELIDYLLSFTNFKVLSLSIDDIGNHNRAVSPAHWEHIVDMMKYFLEKRDEINPDCVLDVKSLILDENAEHLLELHKFMAEQVGTDTHVFQFLKGSLIQHADYMFNFEDITTKSIAPTYTKFDVIKEQLELIRKYNLNKEKISFLHPKIAPLVSNQPIGNIDLINENEHLKKYCAPCKFPWSSVHINFDGNLFPCLAVSMGNVKENTLQEIINGERMTKFRDLIRSEGTVEACNRCGWMHYIQNDFKKC